MESFRIVIGGNLNSHFHVTEENKVPIQELYQLHGLNKRAN